MIVAVSPRTGGEESEWSVLEEAAEEGFVHIETYSADDDATPIQFMLSFGPFLW